jgi:hypothetical protein
MRVFVFVFVFMVMVVILTVGLALFQNAVGLGGVVVDG